MHGQPGYHHAGMQPGTLDGSQLASGLVPSMDPLEALLGPFPCARVRGIPYEATLEDVLVFFQGLVVIDVVLVSHEESGEAFVVFANPMDFQMGLQRDHQNMGNRYLEIFQGKRSDYYVAIVSAKMSQQHHWHGASGSSVNNGTTGGPNCEIALTGSISGGDTSPDLVGQTQPFTPDGAWRKSASPLVATNYSYQTQKGPANNTGPSCRGRNGSHGARGYKGNHKGGHGGGIRDGPHTGYIRMRGLPFQATKKDIHDFFEEYKVIESSTLLTYRADGRATGEGYVTFDDAEDAQAAMALHKSSIGTRYIELFISNKEEHTRNVARSTPQCKSRFAL